MSDRRISRREAIQRVSLMLGGVALAGGDALLTASVADSGNVFSDSDVALLDEIAETILPETETPGAKAAGVGPFVAHMAGAAYDPDELNTFREGLETLQQECRSDHGVGFMEATPEQRLALLQRLDREQLEHGRSGGDGTHYFSMMKQLTLLGYFTSEIGYTQAMRYRETPGRYDPCVPYTPGERTWARHA
ncbi:MAG: gluconate 2-dehydrogenase subunit 3 family protein [Xanthomonadales bacterium]|nr:gluconate 2-dehydrogenase subunit 3 family protein [Xanthomonadales bacterium]